MGSCSSTIHHQVKRRFCLMIWVSLMVLHSQGTKIIWWSVKHGGKRVDDFHGSSIFMLSYLFCFQREGINSLLHGSGLGASSIG